MSHRAIDPEYLAYQYGNAEKLRIRQETHARFSENPQGFFEWMLPRIDPCPGQLVLDAGSGQGAYYALLCARGCRVVALDLSFGMAREAHREAAARQWRVAALQGDAQRLPFRDGAFDRVMANHMLYHVPDQTRALREMRRVLRPGSRVILATNAPDIYERLGILHERAAAQLGYACGPSTSARFSLADLPLVRSVFPSAQVHARDDALLFPDVAPAIRYYASTFVDRIDDPPADGSHRDKLAVLVAAQICEIIDREGVFRVPKRSGCFVADV